MDLETRATYIKAGKVARENLRALVRYNLLLLFASAIYYWTVFADVAPRVSISATMIVLTSGCLYFGSCMADAMAAWHREKKTLDHIDRELAADSARRDIHDTEDL